MSAKWRAFWRGVSDGAMWSLFIWFAAMVSSLCWIAWWKDLL